MEIGESPKPKFTEIIAPQILLPEQNFYDQEPFKQIIPDQSSALGVSEDILRYTLGKIIKANYLMSEPVDLKGDVDSRTISNLMYGSSKKYINLSGAVRDEYYSKIPDLIKILNTFPSWDEYIAEQMSPSLYKTNGDFFNKANILGGMPESYGAWLNRHYTNQQRQMLLGIEEVFPQGAFQTNVSESGTHENPGSKRWRILKASDLIPGRK